MKTVHKSVILAVVIGVLLGGLALVAFGMTAYAQGPMMGAWRSYGMMGGPRGIGLSSSSSITDTTTYGWGPGCGMMAGFGPWSGSAPTGQRLTLDQAEKRAADYVTAWYKDADLKIVEVMEFENNFYAQVREKSTGVNAFELLIDPYTGNVWPEYGPNMMWNTKYGMMGRGIMGMMRGYDWRSPTTSQASADMPVKPEEAVKYAQQYLDRENTGLKAESQPDKFYGYYTIHTLDKDGKIAGMLSVDGYTGRVWYHTWHGKFIDELDLED